MTLPTTHQRTPATTSALREVETNLSAALAALDRRLTALETRLSAMALGASCHPEWVSPGAGPVARARRALVVETVVAASGKAGMTLTELAAYLHIPKQRLDTLRDDLAYLVEEDRLVRMNRNPRWRTRNHGTQSSST